MSMYENKVQMKKVDIAFANSKIVSLQQRDRQIEEKVKRLNAERQAIKQKIQNLSVHVDEGKRSLQKLNTTSNFDK